MSDLSSPEIHALPMNEISCSDSPSRYFHAGKVLLYPSQFTIGPFGDIFVLLFYMLFLVFFFLSPPAVQYLRTFTTYLYVVHVLGAQPRIPLHQLEASRPVILYNSPETHETWRAG